MSIEGGRKMPLGPVLTLPLGFAVFTLVVVAVEIIIGEIAWKAMDHLPEDELDWSEGNRFVVEDE